MNPHEKSYELEIVGRTFWRRINSKKIQWYFFPRVFIDIFTAAPTVDGRTPKQPLGMVLKPCK